MAMQQWLVLGLGAYSAALAAGCSDDSSAGTTGEPISLTLVSLFAPSSNMMVNGAPLDFPYQQAVLAFERNIEATGRVNLEIIWAEEVPSRFPMGAADVFAAVKTGTQVQLIHTLPRLLMHGDARDQFKDIFENLPFGPNEQEFQAWLEFGNGQALYDEFYAPDGLRPFAGGNSGAQMGGWFPMDIDQSSQFSGLTIRIAGFAGAVLSALGATAMSTPVGMVNGLIQDGTLDAAELCCPITDRSFGVAQTAQGLGWIYHYPGWHEPHANAQFLLNEAAIGDPDLVREIENAMALAATETDLFFNDKNRQALDAMVLGGVQFHQFPTALLDELRTTTETAVYAPLRAIPDFNGLSGRILDSMLSFTSSTGSYGRLTEGSYYDTRELPE